MKKVAILMGSITDKPVLDKAFATLDELKIPFEAHVCSAHRTPERATEFVTNAEANGFGVIIAAAGLAAHLAGACAARTHLPIIGIPVQGGGLGGLDALLATVQMPPGFPVATVAVNGAENAALLASQILALEDAGLRERLIAYRKNLSAKADAADRELCQALGKAHG
ncbi:MAG: 5-(carboxyamino)imidazole ribonucleotide mutase [Oscillospiraceae bacterium]|jgi:5-(carboxyamino)imidazole ribonucleotide mutase|nr:5-(carboxyamino)imidazole ribonucleotide mutase [Oscillospiraceae bacterium]